jgi:hypothetical protein
MHGTVCTCVYIYLSNRAVDCSYVRSSPQPVAQRYYVMCDSVASFPFAARFRNLARSVEKTMEAARRPRPRPPRDAWHGMEWMDLKAIILSHAFLYRDARQAVHFGR